MSASALGFHMFSACFLYCCAALYGVTVFSLCCFLLWIVLHLLYCVAVLCCVVCSDLLNAALRCCVVVCCVIIVLCYHFPVLCFLNLLCYN